jgi:hypothetical protein
MLRDFFKLNEPVSVFDNEQFLEHLHTSRHICNVRYAPDVLENRKIKDVAFENVSFSKTRLFRLTFTRCSFVDCLFIGTLFDSVEFHDCDFTDCNFFKSVFRNVYGKPQQFRKAITNSQYANIAVHLYQQLRENYSTESQREFKNEAEYGFAKWRRKNDFLQARRHRLHLGQYLPSHLASWLYDKLFGYGYRLRNLLITTTCVMFTACVVNHYFAEKLFAEHVQTSFVKTVYFTVTTMTTLGAAGYNPDTELGYLFVLLNLAIGISILSATITTIFKKLVR